MHKVLKIKNLCLLNMRPVVVDNEAEKAKTSRSVLRI